MELSGAGSYSSPKRSPRNGSCSHRRELSPFQKERLSLRQQQAAAVSPKQAEREMRLNGKEGGKDGRCLLSRVSVGLIHTEVIGT